MFSIRKFNYPLFNIECMDFNHVVIFATKYQTKYYYNFNLDSIAQFTPAKETKEM